MPVVVGALVSGDTDEKRPVIRWSHRRVEKREATPYLDLCSVGAWHTGEGGTLSLSSTLPVYGPSRQTIRAMDLRPSDDLTSADSG